MGDDPRDAKTQPATTGEGERRREERPRVVALTIAFHPDPRRVAERALVLEQESGRHVALSRHELGFARPGATDAPRPLEAPSISRTSIALRASGGALRVEAPPTVELRVDGAATGGSQLDRAALGRGVSLEVGRVILIAHHAEAGARPPARSITGHGLAADSVRRAIGRVADLAVPVLIEGESGVGKERVARAIHDASGRAGEYVTVNVATLAPTLAAAELFGHGRGAFTGATEARPGLFERAHGGTLFLDEIGEIPIDVQAMLLRALELGEVRRVGTTASRSVDVRVLAATDSDLVGAVSEGGFRAALLHRLRGFVITVPPLRERRDDLPALILELLAEELSPIGEASRLSEPGRWLDRATMRRLLNHPWPGNVRQLRGALRQIVVASRGAPRLTADASVDRLLGERAVDAPAGVPDLRAALRAHGYSFTRAARALGVSKAALYRLADRDPGVRTAADLGADELREALAAHATTRAAAAALEVSERALKLRAAALGVTAPPDGASTD